VTGRFRLFEVVPTAAAPLVAMLGSAAGAPVATDPVLIVGATRDVFTPHAWTVDMARAFTASRVVTCVGAKHVTYLPERSSCIDTVAGTCLVGGRLPDHDIACQGLAPGDRQPDGNQRPYRTFETRLYPLLDSSIYMSRPYTRLTSDRAGPAA